MPFSIKPGYRGPAAVALAAALLAGSFLLGTAQAGSATTSGTGNGAERTIPAASVQPDGKITVTGTGTVTGTPDQLDLSMGVQVSAPSVAAALQQADQAVSRVMAALEGNGVRASDIQTSGLYIQPDYRGDGQSPGGYAAGEQLTATLTNLAAAGGQIEAAVHAGGNATVVDGVTLNLADTSGLLARARTAAIRDAQVKATQFARALGRPLGQVISVSDQTSQAGYPVDYASGANQAARPVPISPGSQQLSVQITVVYAIG